MLASHIAAIFWKGRMSKIQSLYGARNSQGLGRRAQTAQKIWGSKTLGYSGLRKVLITMRAKSSTSLDAPWKAELGQPMQISIPLFCKELCDFLTFEKCRKAQIASQALSLHDTAKSSTSMDAPWKVWLGKHKKSGIPSFYEELCDFLTLTRSLPYGH